MKYFEIQYIARRKKFFAEIYKGFHKTENSNGVGEYAVGLNTKLEILDVLRANLNRVIDELNQEFLTNQSKVDRCVCVAERGKVAPGYRLNLDLAFRTVAALECLIIEAQATWEIAMNFAVKLCRGRRRVDRKTVEKELQSAVDMSWLKTLKKVRNCQTHRSSIWIAEEVSSGAPPTYKPIVLLRNTPDLANKEDWISGDELLALYNGLIKALMSLQSWLNKQLKAASPKADR